MSIQKITFDNIHHLIFINKIGKDNLPIFYDIEDMILSEDEIYVYIENGITYGYIIYNFKAENHIHLKSIAVDIEKQKQGIGRKLIQFLKNKADTITLYVQKGNDAKDFYIKNKFKQISVDENYYSNLDKSCAFYMEFTK